MGLFSKISGLNKVAEAYPDPAADRQYTHTGQTVEIGAVVYQRCCKASVLPEGLALAVRGNPPLLIPWDQLRFQRQKRLHWLAAFEYAVGEPKIVTLTVKAGVHEEMKPFMQSSGA